TDFGDMHGRFHLDDHCMFGAAMDVASYWSIHNPFNMRTQPNSTSLPPDVLGWYSQRGEKPACQVPGAESENGNLWVKWEGREEQLPSTQALFDEGPLGRAFLFNPHVVGDYASVGLGFNVHRNSIPCKSHLPPLAILPGCFFTAACCVLKSFFPSLLINPPPANHTFFCSHLPYPFFLFT
ncbi:MAG: hypothetical protein SGPRY_011475, partial [Prymnesium sp.]